VVGVSADSQETNDRFRESLCLPFPLVGDDGGRIARAYGVRIPLVGLARRVTFLVGPPHEVELVFESTFDIGAHLARVRQALARGA
jgi:peroxiredoxin